MSKFVKVKGMDIFDRGGYSKIYLNLDLVVAVKEEIGFVYCMGKDNNFWVADKDIPILINAIKECEGNDRV